MAIQQNQFIDPSGESMTPMELAVLYGFERSRITWSCPLPETQESHNGSKGDPDN